MRRKNVIYLVILLLLAGAAVIAASSLMNSPASTNQEPGKNQGNDSGGQTQAPVAVATFKNPVKNWNLPDPFVYKHSDGFYYGLGTNGGVCITLYRSDKLTNLYSTGESKVVFNPPANSDHSRDLWAPEIMNINGSWYIYYSAGPGNIGKQRTFVISNSNADPFEGDWKDEGKLSSPEADTWAIDGTVLQQNGNIYFLWSGDVSGADGMQNILISKMGSPTTLTGKRLRLSKPEYDWELKPGGNNPIVNEGPQILQRNGKTFVIYSASYCHTEYYCLGMLTIDDKADPMVLDNWKKSDKPVFSTANGIYGPGHCSFTKSPDDKEDWIVYHARTTTLASEIRTPRIQKFTWNQDGTPNFGEPLALTTELQVPSGQTETGVILLSGDIDKMKNKKSGLYLEIPADSGSSGAQLVLSNDNGQTSQKWKISQHDEGNFYQIMNLNSFLYLENTDGSTNQGTTIMGAGKAGDKQFWNIVDVGNGYCKIVNKVSGMCLDFMESSAGAAQIVQNPYNGSDSQKWELIK